MMTSLIDFSRRRDQAQAMGKISESSQGHVEIHRYLEQ